MSELRRAAELALIALEYENASHKYRKEMPYASIANAIADLRAALAQPEPLTQEIERLQTALRYEENRFSRIGTHGPDCWKWGPGHYECAMRHIQAGGDA